MTNKSNKAVLLECIDEDRLIAIVREAAAEAAIKAVKEAGYINPETFISKEEAAKMMGLNTSKKSWHVSFSKYMNIKYNDPALPSYRNLGGTSLRFKLADVIAFMERHRHQSGS